MRLKELLEIEILKSCKILTEEIGLDNPVESVMVLEALDIENWSKRNQLILTSFYAFEKIDAAELRDFFKKMAQIGVSGLVVKMDRLITMIPTWMIELSFEYQVPLIKMQQDVSYEAIMLAVYEPIINQQSHLLRTYYDVRQRFMQVDRYSSTFDQIMTEFFELIGNPCTLQIPCLDVNLTFGESFENYVVCDKKPMKTIAFTKNDYDYLQLFSDKANHYTTAVQTNIPNPFDETCILTVYHKSAEIPEYKVMILENVIDAIYEQMQAEYLIKQDRFTKLNHLADAILQNTPSNLAELDKLLIEGKMADFPNYQCVAFSTEGLKDIYNKKLIIKKLRSLKQNYLYFEHHHYLVILYNFNHDQITKKKLLALFDEKHLEEQEAVLAISRVKTKEQLHDILAECLDMIQFNQQFYLGSIIDYHDLGIFNAFIKHHQIDQLDAIVPDNLYQLGEENPELFDTFYTFFEVNRNYKQAAEKLFLHPKTIRYRLNKIQDLLEIDLTNPIQMVNYEIGTYLIYLKKRSQKK